MGTSTAIAITAWLTWTRKEMVFFWNETPSDLAEIMSDILPPRKCFYFGDWELYNLVKTLRDFFFLMILMPGGKCHERLGWPD